MILKVRISGNTGFRMHEIIQARKVDYRITQGFLIGILIQEFQMSDEQMTEVRGRIEENRAGDEARSTSLSISKETFENLTKLKTRMENLDAENVHMAHVIEFLVFAAYSSLPLVTRKESINYLNGFLKLTRGDIEYLRRQPMTGSISAKITHKDLSSALNHIKSYYEGEVRRAFADRIYLNYILHYDFFHSSH